MEELEYQLRVLEELYKVKVRAVEWYRAGVRQYKYQIYRYGSPFSTHFSQYKGSRFSFTNSHDALEAGIEYAKKYLEQKYKDDTSY